ncbi:hypothetical protein LMORI2_23630 [Limnohabitans sp. MORI2]|nr:hypothetical protein LMORI2_23630 [Limnohabitans sp. MORI2]
MWLAQIRTPLNWGCHIWLWCFITAASVSAQTAPKAEAAPAVKAEAKKVVKEKAAVVKTDATKKAEAKVPAAAAVIK